MSQNVQLCPLCPILSKMSQMLNYVQIPRAIRLKLSILFKNKLKPMSKFEGVNLNAHVFAVSFRSLPTFVSSKNDFGVQCSSSGSSSSRRRRTSTSSKEGESEKFHLSPSSSLASWSCYGYALPLPFNCTTRLSLHLLGRAEPKEDLFQERALLGTFFLSPRTRHPQDTSQTIMESKQL